MKKFINMYESKTYELIMTFMSAQATLKLKTNIGSLVQILCN